MILYVSRESNVKMFVDARFTSYTSNVFSTASNFYLSSLQDYMLFTARSYEEKQDMRTSFLNISSITRRRTFEKFMNKNEKTRRFKSKSYTTDAFIEEFTTKIYATNHKWAKVKTRKWTIDLTSNMFDESRLFIFATVQESSRSRKKFENKRKNTHVISKLEIDLTFVFHCDSHLQLQQLKKK